MNKKCEVGKSDILIMLIGTSPIPNFICAAMRAKKNGLIYMIHTKETVGMANHMEDFITKRSDIKVCTRGIDDPDNPQSVKKAIENAFTQILNMYTNIGIKNIELNFTGGTKVMSSIAFNEFKSSFSKCNKLVCTYFDGERGDIVLIDRKTNCNHIFNYSKEEKSFDVGLKDIVDMNNNVKKCKIETKNMEKPVMDVSMAIYKTIIKNFNDEDKVNSMIKTFKQVNSEWIKMRNIKFDKDNFIHHYSDIFTRNNIVIDGYKDFREIFKEYGESNKDNAKEVVSDFSGIWLEKVIFNVLNDMKKKGEIDDVINSCSRYIKDKNDFEVDLLILKNYRIYVISVTTSWSRKMCMHKMDEIKLRAEQLGGSEAKVGFVCFYKNKKDLLEDYREIWDYNNKEDLILCWNDIPNLNEELRKWLGR